jgi:predicted transcriptional regulator
MRYQVVLDPQSKLLLDELARPRGNNRSFVVREALRVYAATEAYLDALERDERFARMMDAALADVEAGRLRPHAEAERVVRGKKK